MGYRLGASLNHKSQIINHKSEKGDSEIRSLRIGGHIVDNDFSDVLWKTFLDVRYAVVDVLGGALGYHLDASIRQIADESRELMATGHPVGGKAKTDALNVTRKYDVFRNHFLTGSQSCLSNYRLANDNGDTLIDANCSHK